MSTSIAIATTAAATAANAAAQAEAAKKTAECTGLVFPNYRHETANLAERQTYASCVQHVYPSRSELSGAETIALKVVVILMLLAAVGGGYKGWKDDGPFFAVLCAVLAPCAVAAIVFLGWLVFAAVGWVLS